MIYVALFSRGSRCSRCCWSSAVVEVSEAISGLYYLVMMEVSRHSRNDNVVIVSGAQPDGRGRGKEGGGGGS